MPLSFSISPPAAYAQGKMHITWDKGETVAPGTLVDEHDGPTDQPRSCRRFREATGLLGAMLTYGEYKGSGMAVACELLGGALGGGGTSHAPGGRPSRALGV